MYVTVGNFVQQQQILYYPQTLYMGSKHQTNT